MISKLVFDYLLENTAFSSKDAVIDRLIELSQSYETIPTNVQDEYDKLSTRQLWELIRKLAIEGKKRSF